MTPVLEPQVDYVDAYFPEGLWYDYFTVRLTHRHHSIEYAQNKMCSSPRTVHSSSLQGDSVSSMGDEIRLQAPLDKINLHLREGCVIPTQVEVILK